MYAHDTVHPKSMLDHFFILLTNELSAGSESQHQVQACVFRADFREQFSLPAY